MKKERIMAVTMAAAVSGIALLSGTLAWRSMNQQARNEVHIEANPGGRLHDDFDGMRYSATATNVKNVYVENFTDESDGANIYARIRLDEYLELGSGAGKPDGTAGKNVRKLVSQRSDGKTVEFGDMNTWVTYLWDDASAFRQYVTLNTGGETVYLPTYNKNKDSLDADINGTLEGPDGTLTTLLDAYEDYTKYESGKAESGVEIYSVDEDDYDELTAAKLTTGKLIDAVWDQEKQESKLDKNLTSFTVETGTLDAQGNPVKVTCQITGTETTGAGANRKQIYYVDVDPGQMQPDGSDPDGADISLVFLESSAWHKGATTLNAQLMSMDEWINAGKQPGDYWVYDQEDGWVYWANPIAPGTATGCLLNSISCANQSKLSGEYYYGLNVVAQFATAGDWGTKQQGSEAATGFYVDGISENGLELLNTIAGEEVLTLE